MSDQKAASPRAKPAGEGELKAQASTCGALAVNAATASQSQRRHSNTPTAEASAISTNMSDPPVMSAPTRTGASNAPTMPSPATTGESQRTATVVAAAPMAKATARPGPT